MKEGVGEQEEEQEEKEDEKKKYRWRKGENTGSKKCFSCQI